MLCQVHVYILLITIVQLNLCMCLLYNGTVYVTFIIFKHGKDYPKRDDKNHPTVYDNVITFG